MTDLLVASIKAADRAHPKKIIGKIPDGGETRFSSHFFVPEKTSEADFFKI